MADFRDLPIIFSSGLPRSGSTLLQNLLAQNQKHHCTATNDLLDLICTVRDKWMQLPGFIAQGLKLIEPRMLGLMRGSIYGFYENEIEAGKIIFDKSRGHLCKIELLEQILQRRIKIIVPVRDIRDIVASFEKIYRKSMLTDHPVAGTDIFRCLTVQGRAERLCSPDHTIGYVINTLQDVFSRNLGSRLVIVPYYELTHNPIGTTNRICRECEIEPFICNPQKVEQITQENDTVYGMQLHDVRPIVQADDGGSWKGILTEDFAKFLDTHYAFIQELANRRYLPKINKSTNSQENVNGTSVQSPVARRTR